MTFRTNAVKVQAFAGALFGVQVGTTTMAQVNADITSGGFTNTLNSYYASSFGGVANATVAASVATNLGLTGDALASGTAYITAQLNAAAAGARGAVISNILDQFAGLTADATFGAAATAWNAKVNTANAYTGAANVAIGTEVVANSVFTLTTGVDTFSGTAGNDTFSSTVSATAADNTQSLTDTLNGGAGNDTLNVTVAVLAADIAVPVGNIQSIETVNIRAVDSDGTVGVHAATFVASNASGVTAVNSDRSSSNVTVTGLSTGSSVGVIGDGVVSNGILSFAYATASADQTINISGGTSNAGVASITATASAGVTKATINSTGAANKVDTILLDSAAAGTVTSLNVNAATNLTAVLTAADFAATSALTVTGAATSVDLGTAGNFRTIDASAMTAGGLTIALGTNTTSFKGGAGADVVTTAAVAATAAGAVDGGAGTADILNVAASTHVDTATEAAVYTGFEILRNSHNTDLDVSLFTGITSIQLNGADAGATKMTAAQAAAITNRADNATNTFALTTATGSADVLSVTLANSTATASADLTAATVTGFETVNIVSSSGSSADINAVGFAAAGNLTALNLSGARPVSVATANITKAATIDGSALTFVPAASAYALTLSGDLVKGSSVIGSSAADSITATTAIAGSTGDFVTYNAGSGDDAISATLAALNNNSGANGSVKVEGGAGTDTLTLTDAAGLTLVDANVQFVTGVEKITYAVANQAISITTGGFFDTNFKTAGVTLTLGDATNAQSNTVNLGTFTGATTVTLTATAATTQDQVVTTGSGADKVTVSAAGTTTGDITVSTGGGNDTISVTAAAALAAGAVVTVNGGAGQDAITLAGITGADTVYTVINVAAGQSTLDAFDSVTGYGVSAGGATEGMQLNFDGTADAAANVTAGAVTGYTGAELTYSIASGVLSFAGTSAAALTNAQKATLAQTVVTAANAVVAWSDGTDAWVFHNDSNGDSLVRLVGIATVAGVDDAAANTLTANFIIV